MPIRAKDNHPILRKLECIFRKMEEEGVRISWEDRSFVVTGDDGVEWEIRDLEDGGDFQLGPTLLPPSLEYKLVREAK